MKVNSVRIQGFKRFEGLHIDFTHQSLEKVSNRFLMLGDNGSGKTTILQAVALPLALATRQTRSIFDFDWIGFLPARYRKWGVPHIELEILFTDEENNLTRELADEWQKIQPATGCSFTPPGQSRQVKLTLDGERIRTAQFDEQFQFLGRFYAAQLRHRGVNVMQDFSGLPGAFWFPDTRTLGVSGTAARQTASDSENSSLHSGQMSFDTGVGRLREYLNGWSLARQSRNCRIDYIKELEKLFQRVFPGRRFAGVEMMPGVDAPTSKDYYFLLDDGRRTYDLAEMSAGEQSIFSILYEFVRRRVAHSVVLIDEVDLNLHPAAARDLVMSLTKMAPTCQFILTSHSETVTSVVGESEIYRLPGSVL
ncbi:MAG: AAA family ATPase [Gammaproteobacteria bacterium]|nr:AAA family ATPase [Gammaproteobacteria bacterium]